jgi:hypothetical protein
MVGVIAVMLRAVMEREFGTRARGMHMEAIRTRMRVGHRMEVARTPRFLLRCR